jgi:hypothetical protein
VRSFHLKIAGREEGPFWEPQIAQMFANRRIDRNTPVNLQIAVIGNR